MPNIERKIAKKIRHKIRKIEEGYEIVYSYSDGFDDYGPIYYYSCKNDFDGESWELEQNKNRDIQRLKDNLICNGIRFNKNKYYVHSDLYKKNYFDNDFVKLISNSEHEQIRTVRENIQKIIDKMVNEINILESESKIDTHSSIYISIYNTNCEKKKILNMAPKNNYKDFVDFIQNYSFRNNSWPKYAYYIKNNLFHKENFSKERIILGIN